MRRSLLAVRKYSSAMLGACSSGSGPEFSARAARVVARFARAALAPALAAAASGCDGARQLREWQPSDHQPPPAVVPEGQGAAAEDGDANARAAAALWGMRCASCHGPSGRGDGTGRPPGAALPDMSRGSYQQSRSDAELEEIIANGRGLMPAFKDQLSEPGIAAVVKHIRSLSPSP